MLQKSVIFGGLCGTAALIDEIASHIEARYWLTIDTTRVDGGDA